MYVRLFAAPAAFCVLASCGGSPAIDLGGSELLNEVSLQVVDSVNDAGSAFSDCRVAFDRFGAPHVAYRYRGLTDTAQMVDALRYGSGGSGEWRVDSVGDFAVMGPGFDLALADSKPRILFAASAPGEGPALVEAARDNRGNWNQETLAPDASLIETVRYVGQPTIDEPRAVLPPAFGELFRDGYIAFNDWRFDPVGALETSETLVGFDAAMDREGLVYVCAMVSDGATERLVYAHELEEESTRWNVREIRSGSMASACRISVSDPGTEAIAVLDEGSQGQVLTLLRPDGPSFVETSVFSLPEFGDFDLAMSRSATASLAWVDSSRSEISMAFESDGYAEQRVAVTNPNASAVLALSPDGTLGFCSERTQGSVQELVVGLVARSER